MATRRPFSTLLPLAKFDAPVHQKPLTHLAYSEVSGKETKPAVAAVLGFVWDCYDNG